MVPREGTGKRSMEFMVMLRHDIYLEAIAILGRPFQKPRLVPARVEKVEVLVDITDERAGVPETWTRGLSPSSV